MWCSTGNPSKVSPVGVELAEDVQEGPAVGGEQPSQQPAVGARIELGGGAGIAAIDGRQADVEVPQQNHASPGRS